MRACEPRRGLGPLCALALALASACTEASTPTQAAAADSFGQDSAPQDGAANGSDLDGGGSDAVELDAAADVDGGALDTGDAGTPDEVLVGGSDAAGDAAVGADGVDAHRTEDGGGPADAVNDTALDAVDDSGEPSDAAGNDAADGAGDVQGDGAAQDAAVVDGIDGDATSEVADDTAQTADGIDATLDTAPVDAGPQPCAPALAMAPTETTVLPFDLVQMQAKGGTGAYQFSLSAAPSGGIIHGKVGTYLAGEKAGVSDTIVLQDSGCVGTAKAIVHVVEPMAISPLAAELAPGDKLTPQVAGGSGSFAFSLLQQQSGGKVIASTGAYTAGTKDGDDVLQVLDNKTKETGKITFKVRKGSVLKADPAALLLPVGATATIAPLGGSGLAKLQATGSVVALVGALGVKAKAVGVVALTLADAFLGTKKASVPTRVALPFDGGGGPVGDGGQAASAAAADFDSDGKRDGVLGLPESDFGGYNAGSVALYRGTNAGLLPAPYATLHGTSRDERFGWAVAIADLDGDKGLELIVGAPGADIGSANSGAVTIWGLSAKGLPKLSPKQTLGGSTAGDQAGFSIAVCDFNADGLPDIAAGSPYMEDKTATAVAGDQGGVYVWLGSKTGLTDAPTFARYAEVPDGKGGWTGAANARLGWSVAAGDFDGDGACDLAAGSLYHSPQTTNDGLVVVWAGTKAGSGSMGGLAVHPSRLISGAKAGEDGSQFGRSIAACDLDEDGKAELVVGQLAFRKGNNATVNSGATRRYDLDKLTGSASALESFEIATWSAVGAAASDLHGYRVACGEATGDNIDDVLTHVGSGEVKGGVANVGTVEVYAGVKAGPLAGTPTRVLAGKVGGDFFGLAVVPLSDADGDAVPELLVFASQDDTAGFGYGRPYTALSKDAALVALDQPGVGSGARFGSALGWMPDANGDGFPELLVGAPYATPEIAGKQVGIRAGNVLVAPGTAIGADFGKAVTLGGHLAHGFGDQLGWAVSAGGDFDGDGAHDVVVLARARDRAASYGAGYVKGAACGAAAVDVGAVLVHRGQKGALPMAAPALLALGPQASQIPDAVIGGLDVDGDGMSDFVVGSSIWDAKDRNNAGGVGIYLGRALDSAAVTVLCKPDLQVISAQAGDALGRSLVALSDLDGDGCAEFAAGATGADHGLTNQGAVHVFYGAGAKCKSQTLREVVLTPGLGGASAGISVASGGDVDGDGKLDLLIGGHAASIGGKTVGAIWLVRGSWLAQQVPAAVVDGEAPGEVVGMADAKEALILGAAGIWQSGQYGFSVAMLPGYEADGRAAMLVGAPNGGVGGTALAGGAEILRYSPTVGVLPLPALAVVGDSVRPGAQSGYAVAGTAGKTGPLLAVGSLYGTPAGSVCIDQGDVLVTLAK